VRGVLERSTCNLHPDDLAAFGFLIYFFIELLAVKLGRRREFLGSRSSLQMQSSTSLMLAGIGITWRAVMTQTLSILFLIW
jgi:hypothetical protein